ncbi:hypothetical protein LOTGIDRAFT_164656 [Lottia gigantea]|uniref:UBZ2-type domain-containing protein n=1 Tax=Lottia gigantea TaxID=225164 RepID=V4BM53_LOTGI|nr:hypothetical protein LOTGIDRAFT_164656 [Lottia gigantea]ESO89959.1 hypothetical protein LOTGIDRAFT_164656 [Lottia gigantea]
MAERKRSRLKLKAKKTNSYAKVPGSANSSKKPNTEPITNQMSVESMKTTSVLNLDSDNQNIDVIDVIDDDDDDVSVGTKFVVNTPEPKLDGKLLDLQQKMSKFRLPVCDVWKLDDLPPYIVKATFQTKTTSPTCHTCTEELLPLQRFSMKYLTSKRPDYNFTVDSSEQSIYDIDIAVQKEQGNTYKRKNLDVFVGDSKRKKIGDGGLNIAKCTELMNKTVIDKLVSRPTEDLSCITNNTTTLCPICLLTFPSSVYQIEIDSHIASCLSLADDDVDW